MAHLPKRLRSRPGHWALGAALLCGSTSALAQEPAGLPALDRQVDEAFRQVLKTPASLDAGLKYARLLVCPGQVFSNTPIGSQPLKPAQTQV